MYIGNNEVISNIVKALPYARQPLMFIGPQGIGKYTFALDAAKSLLCLEEANKECSCSSCMSIHAHPDLILISDEGTTKVEKILWLLERLEAHARISNRKVVIVDNANLLTIPAQNKLLKTLEDGHAHVQFILIAHSNLIEPIHSRCQCYDFSPLKEHEIKEYAQLFSYSPENEEIVIYSSQNSIGNIERINKLDTYYEDICNILKCIAYPSKATKQKLLLAFEQFSEKKKERSLFYTKYQNVMDSIFSIIQVLLLDIKKIHLGLPKSECRLKHFISNLSVNKLPSYTQIEKVEFLLHQARVQEHFTNNDLFLLVTKISVQLMEDCHDRN